MPGIALVTEKAPGSLLNRKNACSAAVAELGAHLPIKVTVGGDVAVAL